jgi:hypothetical protein
VGGVRGKVNPGEKVLHFHALSRASHSEAATEEGSRRQSRDVFAQALIQRND